jgi:transcription initiation factor TFIIIB Brf1 subunit/transcription initiation factor TFIIB
MREQSPVTARDVVAGCPDVQTWGILLRIILRAMLSTTCGPKCARCSGAIIDIDEELVCSSCGMVTTKLVPMETEETKVPQALDYTTHALGSFLGPADVGYGERFSRGFSKSGSSFRYLKFLSDFSYKNGAALYNCGRLMDRVCEKLALPRPVLMNAVDIAREALDTSRRRGDTTVAAVSAFAIINSCKRLGIATVGVKEVVGMHANLGYRVKASSLIRIGIDHPVRSRPRSAEEYVSSVVVRLSRILTRTGGMPVAYMARLQDVAKLVLSGLGETERGGHNPRGLAATAVYTAEVILAESEGRTRLFSQREAAGCSQVAEYTVRGQYVRMFRRRIGPVREQITPRETLNRRLSVEMRPIPLESRTGSS